MARWILNGKEKYPWEVKPGNRELATHVLHWNLSGLMYESVISGWKKLGSDKENMRNLQETFANTISDKVPQLVEKRAGVVRDLEGKTLHVERKHRLTTSIKKGCRNIHRK